VQGGLRAQIFTDHDEGHLNEDEGVVRVEFGRQFSIQGQNLSEDMQKFLETLFGLGLEVLAAAEEHLKDLFEEVGEVKGELEMRDLFDGHEPIKQELFEDNRVALEVLRQHLDESSQIKGDLVEHCVVDEGFQGLVEEGGRLADLAGVIGDEG
jgi:hypothetical protein